MFNIIKEFGGEDFSILLEDCKGYLFAHCYVYDNKPSVIRKVKETSREVVSWSYENGYDGVHAITENRKFAEKTLGALFLQDHYHKGIKYGIYKWA